MIDELTPFILRTAAQAGGPVTVGGLMERLRHELSDRTLRRHLSDLISAGRLRAETVSDGRQITVTAAPEQISGTAPPTFLGTHEVRPRAVREPSRLPLRMRADLASKHIVEAGTRDHKRPRPSPRSAEVLALLNEQPMTIVDVVSALQIGQATVHEHIVALRQSGLVLRYATVRSPSGNRAALWVSTQLRPKLPAPPPLPRRRNRIAPKDNAAPEHCIAP